MASKKKKKSKTKPLGYSTYRDRYRKAQWGRSVDLHVNIGHAPLPNRWAVTKDQAAELKTNWRAAYSVWREGQAAEALAGYVTTFLVELDQRERAKHEYYLRVGIPTIPTILRRANLLPD